MQNTCIIIYTLALLFHGVRLANVQAASVRYELHTCYHMPPQAIYHCSPNNIPKSILDIYEDNNGITDEL